MILDPGGEDDEDDAAAAATLASGGASLSGGGSSATDMEVKLCEAPPATTTAASSAAADDADANADADDAAATAAFRDALAAHVTETRCETLALSAALALCDGPRERAERLLRSLEVRAAAAAARPLRARSERQKMCDWSCGASGEDGSWNRSPAGDRSRPRPHVASRLK